MADLLGTDEFLVNRNDVTYTQQQETLMASLQDTDHLLINRAGQTYKITGSDLIESVIDPLEVTVILAPTQGYTDTEVTAVPVVSGGKQPDGGYIFTYQWVTADDAAGTNKTNIAGETGGTFTPTTAQVGKYLGCVVSTTDALGTSAEGESYIGPIQVLAQAPIISDVTVSEIYDGANRYTGKEFPYVTTMAINGEPAPTYKLKAKLSGTTFDFDLMSDVITEVEGGDTRTCQTDKIDSVTGKSRNLSANTTSPNDNALPDSDDFFGSEDITLQESHLRHNGGEFTWTPSDEVTTADTCSVKLGYLNSSDDAQVQYRLNGAWYTFINDVSAELGTDEGKIFNFTPVADGTWDGIRVTGGINTHVTAVLGVYIEGVKLVNTDVVLTFPTTKDFHCFNIDDVVQADFNPIQNQNYSDGTITGTPAQAGTTWDKAFDGKMIIGDVGGVYNLAAANAGDTYNLLFPEPEPINESIQFVYMNESLAGDGLIKVVTNAGTVSFSYDSLPNTATDSQERSQVFTKAFLGNPVSILGFELTGGTGWTGIAGVFIDGRLLTNINDPLEGVKITGKDPIARTITVDGGQWKGENGSGDQANGDDKLVKVVHYDNKLTVDSALNLSELSTMSDKSVVMSDGSSPISQTPYKLTTSQITDISNVSYPDTYERSNVSAGSISSTAFDDSDKETLNYGDNATSGYAKYVVKYASAAPISFGGSATGEIPTDLNENSSNHQALGFWKSDTGAAGSWVFDSFQWHIQNDHQSSKGESVYWLIVKSGAGSKTAAAKQAEVQVSSYEGESANASVWNVAEPAEPPKVLTFADPCPDLQYFKVDDLVQGSSDSTEGQIVGPGHPVKILWRRPARTGEGGTFANASLYALKINGTELIDTEGGPLSASGTAFKTYVFDNADETNPDGPATLEDPQKGDASTLRAFNGSGLTKNGFVGSGNGFIVWEPETEFTIETIEVAIVDGDTTYDYQYIFEFSNGAIFQNIIPEANLRWSELEKDDNYQQPAPVKVIAPPDVANRKLTVDGGTWDPAGVNGDDHIEYETNGGQGEIVYVNTANNEIEISNTGTRNNRWIAGNSGEGSGTSTDFFVAPETPVPVNQDHAWCNLQIINNKAQVISIQKEEPDDPLPVPAKDYSIKFPTRFLTGNEPDDDLPKGTCIAAIVRAENSEGHSDKESNCFMPVDVNPDGAAGPITATTPTTLTVHTEANLDTFSSGNNLVMVDENNDISDYTIVSDTIKTVSSNFITTPITMEAAWTGYGGDHWDLTDKWDDLTAATDFGEDYGTKGYGTPEDITAPHTFDTGDFGAGIRGTNGWALKLSSVQTINIKPVFSGTIVATQSTAETISQGTSYSVSAGQPSVPITGQVFWFDTTGDPDIRVLGVLNSVGNITLTFNSDQDLAYFRPDDQVQAIYSGTPDWQSTAAGSVVCRSEGGAAWFDGNDSTSSAILSGQGVFVGEISFTTSFGIANENDSDANPAAKPIIIVHGPNYTRTNVSSQLPKTNNSQICTGQIPVTTLTGIESPVHAIELYSVGNGANGITQIVVDGTALTAMPAGGQFFGKVEYVNVVSTDPDNNKMIVTGGSWTSTDNPLEGRVWSNSITTTGSDGSGNDNTFINKQHIFDGDATTSAHANGAGTQCVVTFLLDPPITVTNKVTVIGSINASDTTNTTAELQLNDGAVQNFPKSGGGAPAQLDESNDYPFTGELSQIVITKTSSDDSGGVYLFQFEIDGQALVDAAAPGQNKVTYGPVTGTGVFASTDGTDTITLSTSNDRWIDNNNRLSKDFYVRNETIRILNADNPQHVAMQQTIADAFDAFPEKVNERRTGIASSLYRLMGGETLSAGEFELLEETVLNAVNATEPFALNGYYPLYYTSAKADAASSSNSHHTHTIDGIDYYMLDGGTLYHGNYTS